MLYISRNLSKNYNSNPLRKDIIINGKITFEEFLKNGYEDYLPTLNDYNLHQSLFFPEVRLKNYIEIRNHECQEGVLKYSVPAIYKGLTYNEDCLNALIEVFDEFTYSDIKNARYIIKKFLLWF